MDEDSKIVRDEFVEELESVKKIDKKGNKFKVMVINTSFVAAFIFVLYGAIVSYQKYVDKKNESQVVSKFNY